MKILISLENGENIDLLYNKLCSFLSIISDQEIYIDIFHVHKPLKKSRISDISETVDEIRMNEQKMKVQFIAKCEDILEKFLVEKLHKISLVNSFLLEGEYRDVLEKHIVFHSYNLMILNPSKKKDFKLILKGRNTYWAIDNLEIPVLVLPNYLNETENTDYELTCFIDELKTYNNVSNAGLLGRIDENKIEYIHFGRKQIHENVKTIASANITDSITEHTNCCKANKIFVLNHKNKGDFMNFLDKSFTKTVIGSLHNPLLIF